MKEYNYLKGEVAIETKYTEKGETYKVYYENKEYLFGLFSVKGRKIENGIIIIEVHDDDIIKTIVKNGVRTRSENWIKGKKTKVTLFKKEGVLSTSGVSRTTKTKKKNNTDVIINDDDLNYSEDDHLYYYNNELVNEFVYKFHENGKISIKQEYKNGRREGKHTVYWDNGNKKIEYIECGNGEEKDKRYWHPDGSEMSTKDGEEWVKKENERIFSMLMGEIEDDEANNEESGLFSSINEVLDSSFKQEDYSIPLKLTEEINGLIYFENKLFSGFLIVESFKNGKPKRIAEYKDGVKKGKEIKCKE
jgi:antitoxin component YwqK of YwqJK toxin-antitoxin module